MKKNLIRAILFSALCVTLAHAREVTIKNNDDFPMTVSWQEVVKTGEAAASPLRITPTTFEPSFKPFKLSVSQATESAAAPTTSRVNFSEIIPPHSERMLDIGAQGEVSDLKVKMTQRYPHLNKTEFTEFPLRIGLGLDRVHIELNTVSLVKVLLGARALTVNKDGYEYMAAPDWRELTKQVIQSPSEMTPTKFDFDVTMPENPQER